MAVCYLIRYLLVEDKILKTWRKSCVAPTSNGKGDVWKCGNYRGTKLVCHSMKILENIINKRV